MTHREIACTALNFWRYSVKDGLDLTRDGNPADAFTFIGTDPDGNKVVPVKLDRNKTALVVIDMQQVLPGVDISRS